MSFLNIIALGGLGFLAVPILLLLLLHRRKLILPWAAYEWMAQTVVRSRKKIIVQDILKLISKLLLIAALCLMVGRPYLRSGSAGGDTLVIVDVSPSMRTTLENGTRLDKARKLAADFVSRNTGRCALYTWAGELEPVVAEYGNNKAMVLERVRTLDYKTGYAGVSTLASQLPAAGAYAKASRIVCFGDFQECWFGDSQRVLDLVTRSAKDTPMIWVQVDDRRDIVNCAILNLKETPEGILPGRSASFQVEVANMSARPVLDRELTVTVNDNVAMRTPLKLEGREKRVLPVSLSFKEPGRYTVKAALDGDAFMADNVRYAVVDVPPPLRILSVTPPQGKEPFPHDVYLKAALRSICSQDGLVWKTATPLELEAADPDSADIIMTSKLPLQAGTLVSKKLIAFAERGRGVISFLPGEHAGEAQALAVTALVSTNAGRIHKTELKGTILEFMKEPELKPEAITFSKTLLFAGIQDPAVRLRSEAGVLGFVKPVGRGKIMVFGFSPLQGLTDFQYNPNFVQAILRATWEARNHEAFFSDDGLLTDLSAEWINRDHSYTLVDAKQVTRQLSVEGLGRDVRIRMPPTLDPGIYSILEDGQEKRRFGHNADHGDSALDAVDDAALDAATKKGLVYTTGDAANRTAGRRELVPFAAFLLLGALVLEAYAHFFRKMK